MELGHWDPFQEMDELAERVSRQAHADLRPFRGNVDEGSAEQIAAEGGWDIFEMEDEYLVRAHLPAIYAKTFEVSVRDGVLCIQGERRSSHEPEGWHGMFCRSFSLPADIDEVTPPATYKDGVLEVRIRRLAMS